ncbi:MAG: adenylate/guanylate cyclase domain-containing protein [Alphaproteobacteria bacterium]|nr:adenylate/guanylate cyclase domain-containing protein [Alphaproteobacteria bacterium]
MTLRLPIARVLALAFGGLVAVGTGSALLLGLDTARSNTIALRLERTSRTIDRTVVQLLDMVAPAVRLAGLAVTIDPTETQDNVVRLLRGSLAVSEALSGVAILAPTGGGWWLASGDPSHPRPLPFDSAVTAATLAFARTLTGPTWLPPRHHGSLAQATVEVLAPMPDGGAMVVLIALGDLSRLMADRDTSNDETPFILYGQSMVVAHPWLARNGRPLPDRMRFGDTSLAAFQPDTSRQAPPPQALPNGRTVAYRVLDAGTEERWTVGVHYSGDLAAAEAGRVRTMVIGGVALVIGALGLALWVGRRIARPAAALAVAARRIAADGPEASIDLPASRIGELQEAAGAFRSMIDGLRDRQRMRALFGRYVPDQVVEHALSSIGEIRPERRDVAVLFTDIAGWTALAETLPPDQVTAILNRYLDAVVPVIDQHGGIVVDFIGDAVFALFGAPVASANPAADAVAAALALDAAAETVRAELLTTGVGLGVTRIGLHLGPATVGSFGSRDRLKYGAAGDTVNTGSRLEGANKYLGTRILASDALLRAAGPDAPASAPLGRVVMAGRAEGLAVSVLAPLPVDPVAWARVAAAIGAGDEAAVTLLAHYCEFHPQDQMAKAIAALAPDALAAGILRLTAK